MAGYISKDFIHYGCGLATDPAKVIAAVPYSVRKNIKKAERSGVRVRKVGGSAADLDILRQMWYDPSDPNMPDLLSESEYMFIAYVEDEPVGGCILLPVGHHLFLNNLAGNEIGKHLRVQDYLLWHCVNYFAGSEFDYIDVGVSYRPALSRFFRKWQTFTYPVIFNKPDICFPIRMNSFSSDSFFSVPDFSKEADSVALIRKLTGISQFTFAPDIDSAKKILTDLGIDARDKTYDFPGINTEAKSYVVLSDIFSCQFGVLIFNLEISDKDMWDKYKCLDVFKRLLTYSVINDELHDFEGVIKKRELNYDYLEKFFLIDRIESVGKNQKVPSLFRFSSNHHARYHRKLTGFDVEHIYNIETGEIGLPIHQNLSKDHLDYIYGIYRGVLNLCSEWEHTDRYDEYKE